MIPALKSFAKNKDNSKEKLNKALDLLANATLNLETTVKDQGTGLKILWIAKTLMSSIITWATRFGVTLGVIGAAVGGAGGLAIGTVGAGILSLPAIGAAAPAGGVVGGMSGAVAGATAGAITGNIAGLFFGFFAGIREVHLGKEKITQDSAKDLLHNIDTWRNKK